MQTNYMSKDLEHESLESCADRAVAEDSSPTLRRAHCPGNDHAVAEKSSPPQRRAELCGTAVIENRAEVGRPAAAVIDKRATHEVPETDFAKFTRRSVQQQKAPVAACHGSAGCEIW